MKTITKTAIILSSLILTLPIGLSSAVSVKANTVDESGPASNTQAVAPLYTSITEDNDISVEVIWDSLTVEKQEELLRQADQEGMSDEEFVALVKSVGNQQNIVPGTTDNSKDGEPSLQEIWDSLSEEKQDELLRQADQNLMSDEEFIALVTSAYDEQNGDIVSVDPVDPTVEMPRDNSRTIEEIWDSLSEEKHEEFLKMIDEQPMSEEEMEDYIRLAGAQQHTATPKWKAALVKKALEFALKRAGKRGSASWMRKTMNKINGSTTTAKLAITDALVALGVKRKFAAMIAATAVFILL